MMFYIAKIIEMIDLVCKPYSLFVLSIFQETLETIWFIMK